MLGAMRQVWIPRKGSPDVLEVREAPDPTARAGDVLIRVSACGINFADILARMGLYPDAPRLPAVVGYEISGVVEGLGRGVTGLGIGQRVIGMTRFGGYSDVVAVPEVQVIPISDAISFEKAAAVPVNYLTAWLMLIKLGNLAEGERILIHAAGGGVGQAAVQLARWRGAEIYGTASPDKHERLREAGVDHCIDYRSNDFEEEIARLTDGQGVHLVIDAVGGTSFKKSYRSLTPMGRLFLFGISSFAPSTSRSIITALRGFLSLPTFKPIPLMNENRGVFGVNLGHLWNLADQLSSMLGEVCGLIDQGVLDPVVDTAFPFTRAAEAHAFIQDRKNFGKVLLTPD
ncbi:MAG: zinc-binding dehydrogenase [Proteobacteria bacterium]|nr:zinc-binding dehydrogenase [Pseudomonadota bacterium]